jgi:hypothetical protein
MGLDSRSLSYRDRPCLWFILAVVVDWNDGGVVARGILVELRDLANYIEARIAPEVALD